MDVLRLEPTIHHYLTPSPPGKPLILSGLAAYLEGPEKKLNYSTGSTFALWLSSTLDHNLVTYHFTTYHSETDGHSPRKITYEVIASYDNVLRTVKITRGGTDPAQWVIYVDHYEWMITDGTTATAVEWYRDDPVRRIILGDRQMVLMIEDRIIPLYLDRPTLVADWSCNPPLVNGCQIEVTEKADTLTYTFSSSLDGKTQSITAQLQYYNHQVRHYVRFIFHYLGLVATFYEDDTLELVISTISDGTVVAKLDGPRYHERCVRLYQCLDALYHYLRRYC